MKFARVRPKGTDADIQSPVNIDVSTETNGEVSVADQAQPPAAPVRPRPTLYAAVMFVFALFLGAGLALLRDRLDTRLGSEEDLARELDVPILARVPSIARRRLSRSREQRFLEAFRVLRTNIAFLSPQEPLSSVVVDLRVTQMVNGVRGVHAMLRHDAIRPTAADPPGLEA